MDWTSYKIVIAKDLKDQVEQRLQNIIAKGEWTKVLAEVFTTTSEIWIDTTYPRWVLTKAFEGLDVKLLNMDNKRRG